MLTIASFNSNITEAKIKDNNNNITTMGNMGPNSVFIKETRRSSSMPSKYINISNKKIGNFYYSGQLYLTEYVQDDSGNYLGHYAGYVYMKK